MERNTLLAIVLSVLVLLGYQVFFPAPKPTQMIKSSQTTATQEDTKNSSTSSTILPNNVEKPLVSEIEEKKWAISTQYIDAELTNVGGSLHKIGIPSKHSFPVDQIVGLKGYDNAPFQMIYQDSTKSVFSYTDNDLRITKTFITTDPYLITVRMDISATGGSGNQNGNKTMSILENKFPPKADPPLAEMSTLEIVLLGIDVSRMENDKRETMLDEYSVYADKKVFRKGSAVKFSSKEDKSIFGQVQWVGFRDHYSALLVRPEFKTKGYEIKSLTEKELNISVKPEDNLVKNGAASYEFTVFLGPQDINLMKKYGKEFEKSVAFFSWGVIDQFAKAIHYTIPFLQGIVKSWGLSIILISLIIYGLTYPLTLKSMLSMKKMQQVQPKIKALQARFKDDPKKLNAEVMEIYKREKINPLGGCLPMLLQMPIFIALYQVLWRSYYFQGKSFLWIKDLAQPDRLFIMPFSIPFLGNEFNILPILMGIVMFVQQKLSAKSMTITDDQQAMQQKMMMYIFPVFIAGIFYKFASGLSLYFTVFYALSALTQWKMSKVK